VSRILFYAINGVGLGHVARLSVVANAIGRAHPDLDLCFHSNSPAAGSFFDCPGTIDLAAASSPASQYALTSQAFERAVAEHAPDLIVCDTHWPEKLNAMRRSMRRAIVLRMPDAGYAAKVMAFATETFDAVVLPHSRAAIDEWLVPDPAACPFMDHPAVQIVGPLARVATVHAMRSARVLFLLGGGGEYEGAPPVESLVARLHNVATHLRRCGVRSQIVQGPFMKFEVPPGPWDILRTYDVPEYIDERTVVVARPSYNSCAEAVAAGARLVIVGENNGYHEDAVGRAKWLEASGLAVRAGEDITAAVLGELERGWDPVAIRARGAVNAGLPSAVEWLVRLVKENA
jgi:UDP-N-acetylglucosamine--N-acetylmuramyl-(pentapeptide) pyrophosphoryl-undecaprenol N-acetylglucosamine transferase